MNNLSVKFFMIAALLCGIISLASCSSAPATNGKTATVSTDSVGVAECDEYIKKYEACLTKITEKAPQAQPGMKTAFEQQRSAFKQAASTEQGKATLATTCKQAIESAKQSTTAYGCAW